MTVRVKVLGELTRRFGRADVSVDVPAGSTAQDVLAHLATRYSADQTAAAPPIVAFLNGRNVAVLSQEASTLQTGDELLLTYPIGGG